MPVFRLTPNLRGMGDVGIDEAGMAEIEVGIVANPTHPMIRGLKGGPQGKDTAIGNGQAGQRARNLLRGPWNGSFLHDGCVSQE
jgi:hypothetical protein